MGDRRVQPSSVRAWALVEAQHGVVARRQLLELGFSPKAIKHRIATGRLRPVWRGVYAVGRPQLTRYGHWMAAVLACGAEAVLSHRSAAALWGFLQATRGPVDVSVPARLAPRYPGIRVHRRAGLRPSEVTRLHGIPVTTPACTLIDIAIGLGAKRLEAAVNEADKLDLIDPDRLRTALDGREGQHGVGPLRALLDRHTLTLTDS